MGEVDSDTIGSKPGEGSGGPGVGGYQIPGSRSSPKVATGLKPEAGKEKEVVKQQLLGGLSDCDDDDLPRIIIAYEPVWAIGTGKTATPDQAQEMHLFIRSVIENSFDKTVANTMKILYGGSVTPDNVDDLLSMPDLDGALVGGASLVADSFERIVKFKR